MRAILVVITSLLFSACSNQQGRYDMHNDKAPDRVPQTIHVEDAHPKYEPYSLAGNKDYTLNGQSYQILRKPKGYQEAGIASWYGEKFHGHRTSNGEVYDMYSMSAAHKTLPLPSYVEVTNQNNGKKAVVRVNDRGPFHNQRVIDLSYAAAKKLDVLKTGTAPVSLRLISPEKPKADEWHSARHHAYYVQLAALSDGLKANQTAEQLAKSHGLPTHIARRDQVYRVRFGPFYDRGQAQQAMRTAKQHQLPGAFIVTEALVSTDSSVTSAKTDNQ
jgi:rare lipoprotein A